MKTQLSNFYAQGKTPIKAGLTIGFILCIPFGSLIYGSMLYGAVLLINLFAVLPALTIWEAMLLGVPFAAIYLISTIREYRTFAKKREVLKNAFRRYQNSHDSVRR